MDRWYSRIGSTRSGSDTTAIEHRRRTLPGFSHAYIIHGTNSVHICSDCADVTPQMKARRRDLTDIHLGSGDLKSCIRGVTAHSPHDVDLDEAARGAQTNQSMAPAWQAYWKHRALT